MKATLPVSLLVAGACCGEAPIRATVDFGQQVRAWDGFGVNYVETAQTRDYAADPQEYGGFSLLTEDRRQRILDLIFGPDGLKPGLLKMFLDPHHQGAVNTGTFDHTTTTRWIRYFAREGHKKTRARGGDLAIITTLYGPPGWMTKQRFLRGRDLDPALKRDCARYLIEWVKYLGQVEGLPVKYISLHNEGEDYVRWP
jgi:O-glycosyl hydrolase